MKVFISWSGEQSRLVGQAFENWLPSVLQHVRVYFSPSGIEKGASWFQSIFRELSDTNLCIVIVDETNVNSEWINFEAGAISKGTEKSRVCPVLIGMKSGSVTGPLQNFQCTEYSKEEIRSLVSLINSNGGDAALQEKTLDAVFDKWWPDLESAVNSILKDRARFIQPKPVKTTDESINELSALVHEVLVREQRGPLNSRRLEPVIVDLCESMFDLVGLLQSSRNSEFYKSNLVSMFRPIKYISLQLGTPRLENLLKNLEQKIDSMDDVPF